MGRRSIMTWLLSIFSGALAKIAGIGALIAGLYKAWLRGKAKRQAETIEQQDQAIKVNEAKDKAHQHDITEDYNANQQIDEVRQQVNDESDPAAAAGKLGEAFDAYFGDKK